MPMNNDAPLSPALLLPRLASGAGAQEPAKKLYCWNENGRKVCGDALPAEAVGQRPHRIQCQERPEEWRGRARVDRRGARRRGRQAEADQRRAWPRPSCAAHAANCAMAESYATEADLRRAFRSASTCWTRPSRLATGRRQDLRQSLLGLLRQAGEIELAGKPVPANVSGNIARPAPRTARQQTMLVAQPAERAAIGERIRRGGRSAIAN